jgi:hypothetical protein
MNAAQELEQAVDQIVRAAETHQCDNPCRVCQDLLASTISTMCLLEARLNQIFRMVNNGNRTGNRRC